MPLNDTDNCSIPFERQAGFRILRGLLAEEEWGVPALEDLQATCKLFSLRCIYWRTEQWSKEGLVSCKSDRLGLAGGVGWNMML